MPYDLFISYAHQGDNTSREAVTALVARLHAELEADFRRRFGRDLEIFFDKEHIKDVEHWQVRCHRALRDSRFFIACLSRTYLRSDACRWEWEEWCRHELEHGLVGQGAASLCRWKGDLLQRFHIRRYQPGQAFASPEQEAADREIVRELSGLTLAVETATVYLAQRRRLAAHSRRHANFYALPSPVHLSTKNGVMNYG